MRLKVFEAEQDVHRPQRNQSSADLKKILEDPFKNVDSNMIKTELRARIYKLIKHSIQEKMEAYEVRKVTVRALKYVCDMCGDTVSEKFSLIEPSQQFIGNHREIKFLRILTRLPLLGRVFYRIFFDKIYFNYEFIVTLLECSEHINTELSHMSHSLDYKKEIGELREEISANVYDFVQAKESLSNQFPGLVRFIKTKRASYHLLEYQLKQIDTFEK